MDLPRQPDIEVNLGEVPTDIQWSPDESLVAVSTLHSTFILDSRTLKTLHEFPGAASNLYWEADGSSLLILWKLSPYLEQNKQYTITHYDTSTWTMTHHVAGEQLLVNDHIVGIWHQPTHGVELFYRDTFEQVASLENVDSVVLSALNQLATRDRLTGRLTLWQIDEQGIVSLGGITDGLNAAEMNILARLPGTYRPRFEAQGQVLSVDKGSGQVEYWEVSTGARVPEPPQEPTRPPAPTTGSLVFLGQVDEETVFEMVSPTDQSMMDGLLGSGYVMPAILYRNHDDSRIVVQQGMHVYVWDSMHQEILLQRKLGYPKSRSLPFQVTAVDPQGQFLAASVEIGHWGEGAIELYDLGTMERVDRINRKAYSIYWSSDSRHFVAVTRSTLMRVNVSEP